MFTAPKSPSTDEGLKKLGILHCSAESLAAMRHVVELDHGKDRGQRKRHGGKREMPCAPVRLFTFFQGVH